MAAEELDQDVEAQDQDRPEEEAPSAKQKLHLDVKVEKRSACQRHITVIIPREDVDRYFDHAFSELMPTASVPGFRPGRAPRKLIEHRYRKEVQDQVKGELIMDSLAQVTEDNKLAAISEPDLDLAAVELPEEGPLIFEFEIEVRPEFELPNWKGLTIERPMRDFTDADVDRQLRRILENRGRLVPFEGPAEPGDYISTALTFKHDGEVLSHSDEEVIRIRPVLTFRDGRIENFDELIKGVKAGDTLEMEAMIAEDAPNEALRGKTVTAVFDVHEVKKLEVPELSASLLEDLGGFQTEQELRDEIRRQLERQLSYYQQRRAREQVLRLLTVAADWELPPELLRRQSHRELQRAVLELRSAGFSEDQIRAHQNELLQNSRAATARALKEHFILERIAEEEKIEDLPEDYDREIALIAAQSGESVRRVRARLEKQGLMDTLRNQIIERKAIDLILSHAHFKDVPFELEPVAAEAVDQSVTGGEEESDIPEAEYPDEAKPKRPGS
jgi:trigger factor